MNKPKTQNCVECGYPYVAANPQSSRRCPKCKGKGKRSPTVFVGSKFAR